MEFDYYIKPPETEDEYAPDDFYRQMDEIYGDGYDESDYQDQLMVDEEFENEDIDNLLADILD